MIFWCAHADLEFNWSPTIEIRKDHELMIQEQFGDQYRSYKQKVGAVLPKL